MHQTVCSVITYVMSSSSPMVSNNLWCLLSRRKMMKPYLSLAPEGLQGVRSMSDLWVITCSMTMIDPQVGSIVQGHQGTYYSIWCTYNVWTQGQVVRSTMNNLSHFAWKSIPLYDGCTMFEPRDRWSDPRWTILAILCEKIFLYIMHMQCLVTGSMSLNQTCMDCSLKKRFVLYNFYIIKEECFIRNICAWQIWLMHALDAIA